ncbi:unnamed protein product [marine sediment metagenome]|uniref:Uncharacterized protein n=1 Tax=marine sediment metagenome TaxID=412755 RepID=X1J9L4_9ZZZZ
MAEAEPLKRYGPTDKDLSRNVVQKTTRPNGVGEIPTTTKLDAFVQVDKRSAEAVADAAH